MDDQQSKGQPEGLRGRQSATLPEGTLLEQAQARYDAAMQDQDLRNIYFTTLRLLVEAPVERRDVRAALKRIANRRSPSSPSNLGDTVLVERYVRDQIIAGYSDEQVFWDGLALQRLSLDRQGEIIERYRIRLREIIQTFFFQNLTTISTSNRDHEFIHSFDALYIRGIYDAAIETYERDIRLLARESGLTQHAIRSMADDFWYYEDVAALRWKQIGELLNGMRHEMTPYGRSINDSPFVLDDLLSPPARLFARVLRGQFPQFRRYRAQGVKIDSTSGNAESFGTSPLVIPIRNPDTSGAITQDSLDQDEGVHREDDKQATRVTTEAGLFRALPGYIPDQSRDNFDLRPASRRALDALLRELCAESGIGSPVELAQLAGVEFTYLDMVLIGEVSAIDNCFLIQLAGAIAGRLANSTKNVAKTKQEVLLRLAHSIGVYDLTV